MQVLVLAVQNAVDFEDLGVATSGATLFRFIGGSVGTAVLGAIFTARLSSLLARAQLHIGDAAGMQLRASALRALPPNVRATFLGLFTQALSYMFVVAAAIAFVGFLLTWLLPEKPLRHTVAASASSAAESCATPSADSPLAQIERSLTLLGSRDTQRALLERMAARAGVDLSPAACWMLGRLADDPHADVDALATRYGVDRGRLVARRSAARARTHRACRKWRSDGGGRAERAAGATAHRRRPRRPRAPARSATPGARRRPRRLGARTPRSRRPHLASGASLRRPGAGGAPLDDWRSRLAVVALPIAGGEWPPRPARSVTGQHGRAKPVGWTRAPGSSRSSRSGPLSGTTSARGRRRRRADTTRSRSARCSSR